MGLVSPRRTAGRGRRYSARDISMLRLIQRLSQEEGVNLEGIRRILQLETEVEQLRAQLNELAAALVESRSAPPGARVWTADRAGGVHLGGGRRRPWSAPKALPGRASN
jgi:MerR family transcriptional regulator/heat shock protein HspR